MNASDFDRIERELGIVLPPIYRARLSGNPSFPGAIARQIAIPEVVEEILAINRECRRSGHPAHRFALGFAENADNAFGLDLSRDPAPVLRMRMSSGDAVEEASDLEAWIELLGRSALSTPSTAPRRVAAERAGVGWRLWRGITGKG